jgi:hypothetical protein
VRVGLGNGLCGTGDCVVQGTVWYRGLVGTGDCGLYTAVSGFWTVWGVLRENCVLCGDCVVSPLVIVW